VNEQKYQIIHDGATDDISIMSILSGGVPTEDRHTGERALKAIDIRFLHSAANDGRPISRMSCYASAQVFILSTVDQLLIFKQEATTFENLRLLCFHCNQRASHKIFVHGNKKELLGIEAALRLLRSYKHGLE
jgi:hypothetical protein